MRLLISHGGVMKIYPNANSYTSMIEFIQSNFQNLPQKFNIAYRDVDDDLVTLCSQHDIDALIQTVPSNYVKVSIQQDSQNEGSLNSSISRGQSQPQAEKTTQIIQEEKVPLLQQQPATENILNGISQLAAGDAQDGNPPHDATYNTQADQDKTVQIALQDISNQQQATNLQYKKISQDQEKQEDQDNHSRAELIQEKQEQADIVEQVGPSQLDDLPCQASGSKEAKAQEEQNMHLFKGKFHGQGWGRCHNQQWRKNRRQRHQVFIAQQVDKRIQVLMPILVERISLKLQGGRQQNISREEKGLQGKTVHHQVKCNSCSMDPILGVRYKCTLCPEFNLCQICQHKLQHPHNMIKIRFVEVKAEPKPEKCFWWDKPNDPRLQFTNKCFTLSEHFGGQADQYEDFVKSNVNLPLDELMESYISQNPQSLTTRIGSKLTLIIKKLAFYFRHSTSAFQDLVRKNPSYKFRNLITLYNESLNGGNNKTQKIKGSINSVDSDKNDGRQQSNQDCTKSNNLTQSKKKESNVHSNENSRQALNILTEFYNIHQDEQDKMNQMLQFCQNNSELSVQQIIELFKKQQSFEMI